MGCVGMSRDDFCRCTPSQFYAAYEAWSEMQERMSREMWERTRMQCLCTLQPYSKKQLKARDIIQFPWDGEMNTNGSNDTNKGASSSRSRENGLSHEELMERYRQARLRAGL